MSWLVVIDTGVECWVEAFKMKQKAVKLFKENKKDKEVISCYLTKVYLTKNKVVIVNE